MKVKISLTSFVLVACLFFACSSSIEDSSLTAYVNPFIGTGGTGHTYPGASMPFGMVQLSPDTHLEGWAGCSGYHHADSVIYGFSHTHLSGTGIPDYGDVLLMPTSGRIQFDNGYQKSPDEGYASRFSHDRESASPGYYYVHLPDYDIDVELTVTERAGFHQYTFNKAEQSSIIVDLEHRDQLLDVELEIVGNNAIRGKRLSRAWAEEQYLYFYAEFSREFTVDSFINADGQFTKCALKFDTRPGDKVHVKVGISAVDMEGAKNNLAAEIPHWDFADIRRRADNAWDGILHKIEVEDDDEEKKTIFYTALYHCLLSPNLFMDVDGRYRGMDLKVHTSNGRTQYTVFSLWDTFRALHPLFTIIEQDRTNEFINTFLDQYEKGGILPIWELAANYTGCMIGYHGIPVITDAYVKGIRDYDANLALEAMKNSAEQDHLGLDAQKAIGFIPADHESESVSKTLEYAYDDWCIAVMANALGQEEDYQRFVQRGQYYKNIFDPSTGFMRARMNYGWFGPFDPAEVNFHYTEANSWQYSFFVPQDLDGLIALHGGEEAFEHILDELFGTSSVTTGRKQVDITGLIGQYAHGNEPSHHMAYLYNYIDKPGKTQRRVSQILNDLYKNAPDGLSGNEDCGQMSAWYVLSAMGIYPVTPGLPYYAIGTPLFEKVTINLEDGETFEIIARDLNEENIYVQSATLNGMDHRQSFIEHKDIVSGGTFEFTMGEAPNDTWFVEGPVSSIDDYEIVPAPFFDAPGKTFRDKIDIKLGCVDTGALIFYSLDGDPEFRQYSGAIELTQSTTISAYASRGGERSFVIEAGYLKIDDSRSITLFSEYANQYAAGGDLALIDRLRGRADFRTGSWQGYQAQDLEVVLDLGKVMPVSEVAMGFLQDIRSWIWFPPKVTFEMSRDGDKYHASYEVPNDFPDNEYGGFIKDFTVEVNERARFIRIKAPYYGDCPDWHLGSGGKTWLFADEIIVK